MKYLSKSLDETKEIAKTFLNTVSPRQVAVVVALEGDLGTGKTTFAQAIGEYLGVEEDMHSPTFVIEKVYNIDWKGFKKLIHIDAYRLETETELMHLGWQELVIEPENLILIEWPARVKNIVPAAAKSVLFTHVDERKREITFETPQDKENAS